jgi:hypothetical protein
MALPGMSGFVHVSPGPTGVTLISRTKIGDGQGVYQAFFTQKNITRITIIDGTGTIEPSTNTNYLVYNLTQSADAMSPYMIS